MYIEQTEVLTGIVALKFKTQYDVCSTMMRMQDFYESPLKNIRGQVFSLEYFMDTYAKKHGDFTYTADWAGFNVPGHIVKKFFEDFECACEPLLKKEEVLRGHLEGYFKSKFYVVGYSEDAAEGTLDHEIAHGIYYLNPSYKRKMLKLVCSLEPDLEKAMNAKLLAKGYCRPVLKDEIQAYLATSDAGYLKYMFGKPLYRLAKPFREIFKEYKDG